MTYKKKKLQELKKAERLAIQTMEMLVKKYPIVHADMFDFNMRLAGATPEAIKLTSAKTFRAARLKRWIVRSSNYILSSRISKRRAPMVLWDSLVYENQCDSTKQFGAENLLKSYGRL